MQCDRYLDAIGDLVDGSIGVDARRELAAHLRTCDACTALVAELTSIREAAGSLERLQPPPASWERIRAQTRLRGGRVPSLRGWLPLAAAALILLAVAVGYVLQKPGNEPAAASDPAAAANDPAGVTPDEQAALASSVEAKLRLAEQHYQEAIRDLEKLAQDREALDPQVAAALQKNMQVVDQAIDESRAALRTEPESEPAQQSLFDAFRTKVTLLQDTIALINEMRKGNQAEAARIAEGLDKS
jgi:tetratricopeptide (TPR) repeat protein